METEGTRPLADLRERLQATLRGAYTLQRELGGGGMSRVFLAEDTRLGRRVVVKLLHPDLAAGLSAERFEREILLAARLQHPHIVPFLSAGEVDGLPYYMMPFIEGETLRARFARDGALPVGDALRLIRELADALAYAHAHGVMHRDLKPENILLSGGHAVVADFGVAKALASATLEGTTDDSGSTTGATTGTALGVAVGTPAYMAPEQAAADPAADHRVDLYALGLIAYEALAGAHPFAGRAPSEMVAAQLTQVPAPLAMRRSDVPRAAVTLVTRLLAKRPDDRPASAADVVHALDEVTTPADGTLGVPAHRRTRVVAGIGLAVLGAAAVVWWMRAQPAATDRTPVDRTAPVTRPLTFSGAAREPEYSRDGQQIAYVQSECAPDDAQPDPCAAATLRVIELRTKQSEVLLRAASVAHPHWSADGAWLVVLVTPADGEHAGERGTYVVPRHGGDPRWLAPQSLAEFGAGGDTLYIATAALPGAPRFVRRVHAATGATIDSAALPPTPTELQGFHSSPDGRWLALRYADRILLATPDRRATDTLLFGNFGSLRWSSRGDALYALVPGATATAALLKRVGVDAAHGRFVGGMETVLPLPPSGDVTFDVSPEGRTLVRTGGTITTTLWALDQDARPVAPRVIDRSPQWLGPPSLSADGESVAYEATDEVGQNVYVQPFTGGHRRAITRDSTGWQVWGWVPGTKLLTYAPSERPESLYAQRIPDGPRHFLGATSLFPLADGGSVALESQRRLVFRTAAGAERTVLLPDSLDSYLGLLFADADGGGAYVSTLRGAGSATQHERWIHVDRASGALQVVTDLAPQQLATTLAAGHGDVVYATWVVRTEPGRPTVWRGRAGRPAVKVAELPLQCQAGSLTMSADGRRFACLAITKRPDLFLVEHFDGRR